MCCKSRYKIKFCIALPSRFSNFHKLSHTWHESIHTLAEVKYLKCRSLCKCQYQNTHKDQTAGQGFSFFLFSFQFAFVWGWSGAGMIKGLNKVMAISADLLNKICSLLWPFQLFYGYFKWCRFSGFVTFLVLVTFKFGLYFSFCAISVLVLI